ncbi:hypothetical protein AB3X96_42120 [Paraburkholderia sp. BR13439]|nr:hypothetical protein [Paraburkholderia youngii]
MSYTFAKELIDLEKNDGSVCEVKELILVGMGPLDVCAAVATHDY